ncbi:MAG: virulence factor SrfB [Bacteroidales bacterium]|nr:virulence factor SrfB [Bacteroidales bacterium]
MISLIANTGIQLMNFVLDVQKSNEQNDKMKMFFHEWIDDEDKMLKLEIAHRFHSDEEMDEVWVRKHDLFLLGCVNKTDGCIKEKWDDIKESFYEEAYQTIDIETEFPEDSGCFSVDAGNVDWKKFENVWLPMPFFKLNQNGKSQFGPTNWCRFKLIPAEKTNKSTKYDLLLAFDTRSFHENDVIDELKETPIFVNEYDRECEYAICNDEFKIVDYCSAKFKCKWVDEYVLQTFHEIKDVKEIRQKPKLKYLAQFIFILKYIQQMNVLPTVLLCSDRVESIPTDLVIDIGNSRTCAVLFDDGDFTKVEQVVLQNFTEPIKDHKLNRQQDSFDMRLAFREADFGGEFITGSRQFVYPSLVRLGDEAKELIYKTTNENTGQERITTFSSPKRYLWDNKPQNKEWQFVTLGKEKAKPIYLRGISEQINPNGSLNCDGTGGQLTSYSRKTLMTFCFLEILAQANMQINSYDYRHRKGNESSPRVINKVIVTAPAAMSRKEQVSLRKSAEDAVIIHKRFHDKTYSQAIDEADILSEVKVVPSPNRLTNSNHTKEWIYDEATCSQFVFLYAEISQRYLNKCRDYFELYGKNRSDIEDYDKKSLTIGSVDIGAGTTDLMIATYKYNDDNQCTLTPIPMFWESFYYAGDDMLKEIVRRIVIEGEHSGIQQRLVKDGRLSETTGLISGFFGKDDALMTRQARQVRSDFNLQVSMPIALYCLDLLQKDILGIKEFGYDDVFVKNKPTQVVHDFFEKHFGFKLESVKWTYNYDVMCGIVENVFDNIVGKISAILSYYNCDIVILSGRPTSLKPLSNLFLKYYAVSPNRLIKLNDYRVGNWYPFHGNDGYFGNTKSIVAIGAMIGYCAYNKGELNGFKINLEKLGELLRPTTEYFGVLDKHTMAFTNAFITPDSNKDSIKVPELPFRIGCRQLNNKSYPSRPFYTLDINTDKLEARIKNKFDEDDLDPRKIKFMLSDEITKIRRKAPYTVCLKRDNYNENKEDIVIESIKDCNNEDMRVKDFLFQVQSLSESDSSWLDTGEFTNLNITPLN